MTSRELASVIEQSAGRIISVRFVKNDGSIRLINCMVGVKHNLKGGPSYVNHNQYVHVFDVQKRAYRNINRDGIIEVKYDKKVWNSQTPSLGR